MTYKATASSGMCPCYRSLSICSRLPGTCSPKLGIPLRGGVSFRVKMKTGPLSRFFRRSLLVLVVDDEPDIVRVQRDFLRTKGFRVARDSYSQPSIIDSF